MCCSSRSSIAITIASTYICMSVFVFIVSMIALFEPNRNSNDAEINYKSDYEHKQRIFLSLITLLISIVFIVAIKKRYHYLIFPWLILCAVIFYKIGQLIYFVLVTDRSASGVGTGPFIIMILAASTIIIQISIFWLSYSLFDEIRQESINRSESLTNPGDVNLMAGKSLI
ncbi:uncharacterized protein ACRADG_009745 [Cochliomyia hominivorax]